MIEEFRGAGVETIYLRVLKSNQRAKRLYEYIGFEEVPGSARTHTSNGVVVADCLMIYRQRPAAQR